MQNHSTIASFNPYLRNQVVSASPTQLIVLLYDGIIRVLKIAEDAFEESNPQDRFETIHSNLIRAQNIISELNACLDFESGGDIAHQLHDLYEFFNKVLRTANLSKDTKDKTSIFRIRNMVADLREAWQQVATLEHALSNQPQAQAV